MDQVETAQYQVSKSWWFPELGRKPDAGEVVELPVEAAERYMHNEPGLLAPIGRNTQAKPTEVRATKPKSTTRRKK